MKELSWSAPEFEYHHKPHAWYLWLGGVSLALILAAIWQGNFLFAIFVMMAAGILISTAKRVPRYIDYQLTDEAVVIGYQKSYLYEHLSGFAARKLDDLEDGLSELIIQRKHRLGGYIRILFPTKHTQEIRHFLNRHLPELEYEDTLSDHLSRWLKF